MTAVMTSKSVARAPGEPSNCHRSSTVGSEASADTASRTGTLMTLPAADAPAAFEATPQRPASATDASTAVAAIQARSVALLRASVSGRGLTTASSLRRRRATSMSTMRAATTDPSSRSFLHSETPSRPGIVTSLTIRSGGALGRQGGG